MRTIETVKVRHDGPMGFMIVNKDEAHKYAPWQDPDEQPEPEPVTQAQAPEVETPDPDEQFEPVTEAQAPDDLSILSKAELIETAESMGLEIKQNHKKAEIIEMIKAATEEDNAE